MALIKCRNCGREISDRASDCIHCGELIVKENTNVTEAYNRLVNEQNKNAKLETERNNLLNRSRELEKQVSDSQKTIAELEQAKRQLTEQKSALEGQLRKSQGTVNTLERRIDTSQKAKSIQKSVKERIKQIGRIMRLILVGFFVFAAMVSFASGEYKLAFWYGAIAIAVAPYLYRLAWQKIKVPWYVRFVIEVIVPIIVAFI